MCLEQIDRCKWAHGRENMIRYHDQEWGRPQHDENKLFEMLLLESFQAGLSWACILDKREAFRKALDGFDARKIARYDEEKIESLMQNKAIVRNRLKLNAAVNNAKVVLKIQQEFGSFDQYLWGFTDGKVIRKMLETMPASTALSDRISNDLKRRGMKFVGTVIIYSYLQAVGVVNDHEKGCEIGRQIMERRKKL